MKKKVQYYLSATLNSYAILFFSQNRVLGALLLLVSFFNVNAGLSGLICTLGSLVLVTVMGFSKAQIKQGLYSFNSLLVGIGFGTFFSINFSFCLWLIAASLLCIVLSVNLSSYLSKYGLPTLSVPFVITFWLVLLAVNGYPGMGLMQENSSLLFELSTENRSGFAQLSNFFNHLNWPFYVSLFFRSISAVLFQHSIFAGVLISIGFFIHSRIAFSLLVIGFITACLINHFIGVYPEGISNYHLGANFMMVSCGIGGFFLIPSWRSYVWAIVAIPFTFLLLNGISSILGVYNLPVFSMPFCVVTIGVLYFFMMRKTPGKLQLTPFQYYSPETNLYQFLNGKIRLKEFEFLNIALPFMGSWTISQGYDGEVTHKGDWNQALDFVIKDLDHKTYELPGIKPEDYYCFNKPVLACADGIVEECINYVDDNPIGQVNLVQNWGNTVIIKHAEHLYSKVSHLKKNSLKVKAGDFVKKGTIIALCGNSGRSPEPHLHFQIQSTPYLGSKTIAYPLAYYVNLDQDTLTSFEIPEFGQTIHSPDINAYLKRAFNFKPGYVNRVKTDKGTIETWEVFTDAYNASYFYCHENQSVAYFVNNAHVFYFTKFYGSHHAILFLFYQAAYKINFSAHAAQDVYAMDTGMFNPKLWIRDLVSPFLTYTPYTYSNAVRYGVSDLSIVAEAGKQVFGKRKVDLNAEIKINDKGISEFELVKNGTKITVVWETELS